MPTPPSMRSSFNKPSEFEKKTAPFRARKEHSPCPPSLFDWRSDLKRGTLGRFMSAVLSATTWATTGDRWRPGDRWQPRTTLESRGVWRKPNTSR
eukprot:5954860-Prymnesium_polylepis.1